MQATRPLSRIAFGLYELDPNAGELWRSGYRVKLQSQPFKVLTFLLERPGEIVTREQLQDHLWSGNTTVDFDHSLATAINKIREALRDSAENPRFVETLAKRGYRFIAPVHRLLDTSNTAAKSLSTSEVTEAGMPVMHPATGFSTLGPKSTPEVELPRTIPKADAVSASGPEAPTGKGWKLQIPPVWALAALGLLLALVGYALGVHRSATLPPHIVQLTHSGHVNIDIGVTENLPASATDGYRLFIPVVDAGRAALATVPVSGGPPTPLNIPEEVASPTLGDISPDGSRLLLRSHLSPESEQPLWVVPTTGGSALRVGGLLAHDATWMPDGKGILYASDNDLYLTHVADSRPRLFASLPGRAFWLRWNSAATLLRFTLIDPIAHTESLWQLSASDRKLQRILRSSTDPPMECCGVWTADGSSFVFQAEHGGNLDLWRLAGNSTEDPVRLTDGPLRYQAPVAARNGRSIFFLGVDDRSQLKRLTADGQLVPEKGLLASAFRVEYSRDRKWVAWTDNIGRLWRSAADGTQIVQLTPDSLDVFLAQWSPDGSRLAFMAREPGKAWSIYMVAADGREIRPLLQETRNAADPSWSPDGQRLVFGRINDPLGKESEARTLHILNLGTQQLELLPNSDGLFSPRWSPDGQYIAALSLDQREVMLFNVTTRQWKKLAVHSGADPVWAADSHSLYLHEALDPAHPIDKISVPDGKIQQLIRLSYSPENDAVGYIFAGLTADDQPLIVERTFTGNVYSLQLGLTPTLVPFAAR